jgi:hypothetical protein
MPHEYGALIAELRDTLTRQRYNRVVVYNYCRNADCFLSYLAERGVELEAVTPTEVADYLRLVVRAFRKRHGRARACYWVNILRAGIHGLLKLAMKCWPPGPAAVDEVRSSPPGPTRTARSLLATSINSGCATRPRAGISQVASVLTS